MHYNIKVYITLFPAVVMYMYLRPHKNVSIGLCPINNLILQHAKLNIHRGGSSILFYFGLGNFLSTHWLLGTGGGCRRGYPTPHVEVN